MVRRLTDDDVLEIEARHTQRVEMAAAVWNDDETFKHSPRSQEYRDLQLLLDELRELQIEYRRCVKISRTRNERLAFLERELRRSQNDRCDLLSENAYLTAERDEWKRRAVAHGCDTDKGDPDCG